MKKSRQPLTNRRISLAALTFAAALSLAPASAGSMNNHGKEKGQDGDAVLEMPGNFKPPVKITLIRSQAGVIEPGRRFPADEDWFKGLAFTLRNDSEQPVTHISVHVTFPRLSRQEGEVDFGEELSYGESPVPYPDGRIPVNTAAPILPGESIELRLSDYEGLRAMLTESKFPRHIRRLRVNIYRIEFGDGTIWMFGRKFVWNKDTRDKLIPIEKKRSATPGRGKFVKARALSQDFCGNESFPRRLDCASPYCYITEDVVDGDIDGAMMNVEEENRCQKSPSNLCSVKRKRRVVAPCMLGFLPCPYIETCTGGYVQAPYPDCTCQPSSPVVLDVEGDGFALTGAAGGVLFDINGDGWAERLPWTEAGSDDSWLALDRDGNGAVDSGMELFGNLTPQPASGAPNGFLALSEFDRPGGGGNGDGVIDARDAVFSHLRLWRDANHDGLSEPDELSTLAASDVARLHLGYKESKRTDDHGNQFKYRAKVDDAKGAKVNRWAWDVFLAAGS